MRIILLSVGILLFLMLSEIAFSIALIIMIKEKYINVYLKKILLILVLFEHLFFYYFNNILHKDQLVDPIVFYKRSIHLYSLSDVIQTIYPGTMFMIFVTKIFTVFSQNFVLISLFFSLFSFIPYYFIINKYYEIVFKKKEVFLKITFLIFIFLPSIHIWMTSIYKETLIFPLMYLFLEKINTLKEKNIVKWDTLLYVILLFFLRPYLVGILIMGGLLVNYKYLNRKIIIVAFLSSVFFLVLFWYLFFPEMSIFNIRSKLLEINETSKSLGYSSIDLNTTNYFQRLIYMLFRPLFFDSNNRFQFFASFENLLLVGWLLIFLYQIVKKKVKINYLLQNIYIVSSVFIWLFIGVYIYNYGLASRMKVMIVPFFLLGIIDIFKNRISEKNY